MISIVLKAATALTLCMFVSVTEVKSHSWYDRDCCSDNDCAPVLTMDKDIEGNDVLTTKFGTVTVPKEFDPKRRRQSRDDKYHACMRPVTYGSAVMTPLCVYYPALY